MEKDFDEKKLKKEFYELKIDEILKECKSELNIIEKNDTIDDVLSLLMDLQHVWVVDSKENMQLLGVINRVDLLHLLAPPRSIYQIFSLPESFHHGTIGEAEDIMDSRFITCECNDNIVDILRKMIRHTTEKLAVLSDEERLIGEINLASLIHQYYKVKKDATLAEKNES